MNITYKLGAMLVACSMMAAGCGQSSQQKTDEAVKQAQEAAAAAGAAAKLARIINLNIEPVRISISRFDFERV